MPTATCRKEKIGSGDVLHEPDGRHVCIVRAKPKAASDILLPFEADDTLALTVSEAPMLRQDDRIRDNTVRRQVA